MKRTTIVIFMFLILLVACTPQEEAAPEPTPEPVTEATNFIVLGDIDADDPVGKVQEFQPIADYLAENLSEFGIGGGEVKIAPDIETMIRWMESGEVDVYYDSLFPSMIVANGSGAQPLLRGWRGGEPIYRSVFFVLSDSGISGLEDLNGTMISYDDRVSTSGYMMPTAHLISNGLNPIEKASAQSVVADGEVGYVFSQDDENTIEWVLSGLVDVGVVDNLTYENDIPEETRESLTIIAETVDVPRRVLMIGPDIDAEMSAMIAEVFMGLDDTEEGTELLAPLKTVQFDEFPGGVDAVFDPIQEMFDLVNEG